MYSLRGVTVTHFGGGQLLWVCLEGVACVPACGAGRLFFGGGGTSSTTTDTTVQERQRGQEKRHSTGTGALRVVQQREKGKDPRGWWGDPASQWAGSSGVGATAATRVRHFAGARWNRGYGYRGTLPRTVSEHLIDRIWLNPPQRRHPDSLTHRRHRFTGSPDHRTPHRSVRSFARRNTQNRRARLLLKLTGKPCRSSTCLGGRSRPPAGCRDARRRRRSNSVTPRTPSRAQSRSGTRHKPGCRR